MILFFMFLAALNFVNRFYICVYAAAILFVLTPNRKLRLNYSVLALLMLGVSTLLFDPTAQDAILDMVKPFTFALCFVLGAGLFRNKPDAAVDLQKEEKRVSSVVYVMAGGTFLHFLLNMFRNWSETQRSVLSDFWTRKEMSATGQAAMATLAVAVACSFLFGKVSRKKKAIAIVIVALVVAYNLVLAGRTLFALLLIALVVAGLFICIEEKKNILKPVLTWLMVAVVLVGLYNADAWGLRTQVESSNFYVRFYGGEDTLYGDVTQDMGDDARMDHKAAFIKRMLDHPWGGGNIRAEYGHSAHDLYLDTYDEAGVFALCSVVAYIVGSLSRLRKCIKNKKFSIEFRVLMLCTYLICNIMFWMEPIIRGIPWLFAAYCFVDGAVTHLLMRERGA